MEPCPNNIVSSSSKENPDSSSSKENPDSSSSKENPDSSSFSKLLVNACSNGQMDVIDSLLELGVDVNSPFNGSFPLHQACIQTNPWTIDVVTKLIIHGADVDLEDEDEWNAIDFALSINPFQPHVAQLLLDCSKKGVNRLNSKYFNYFGVINSFESAKFLIENGIDIKHLTT